MQHFEPKTGPVPEVMEGKFADVAARARTVLANRSAEAIVTLADLAEAAPLEKTAFSCCAAEGFNTALDGAPERHQIVLTGMETHVCVLQTALELQAAGRQVFVVADAVCSRAKANHKNALRRLASAGVIVANTESMLFEWMRDAKHPQFKAISQLLK
ncbi:MAG: isochorismatase family protein [Pseudolabrys sp.]